MSDGSSPQHRTIHEIKELFQSWKGKYERTLDLITQRLKEQDRALSRMTSLEEEKAALLKEIARLRREKPPPSRPAQWERVVVFLRERMDAERTEAHALREELWELQEKANQPQVPLEADSEESQRFLEQLEKSKEKVLRIEREWERENEEKLATQAELRKVQKEKEELETYYRVLQEEFFSTEKSLDEAVEARHYAEEQWKQEALRFKEQEHEWQERLGVVSSLENEKKLLENALQDHEKELEEKEGRMKTAQQHLAKKVKENALLSEEVEKKNLEIRDLTSRIQQLEAKNGDLQETLKQQQEQQTRSQEQFHQMLQTLETQLNRKDEKYFQIFEKCKMLEEKHNQMQNFFSNMGHLIDPMKQEMPKPPVEPIKDFTPPPQEEKEMELFSFKPPPVEHKESLFDSYE